MHANFSTTYMREVGGKEYFEKLMEAFKTNRADHIAVYGPDNHMRLTGKHETASIDTFSYGIADRGASIRVPHSFVNNGYKGYLEDRRPNSQGDPYQIASQILKTIASVPTSRQGGRGLGGRHIGPGGGCPGRNLIRQSANALADHLRSARLSSDAREELICAHSAPQNALFTARTRSEGLPFGMRADGKCRSSALDACLEGRGPQALPEDIKRQAARISMPISRRRWRCWIACAAARAPTSSS